VLFADVGEIGSRRRVQAAHDGLLGWFVLDGGASADRQPFGLVPALGETGGLPAQNVFSRFRCALAHIKEGALGLTTKRAFFPTSLLDPCVVIPSVRGGDTASGAIPAESRERQGLEVRFARVLAR